MRTLAILCSIVAGCDAVEPPLARFEVGGTEARVDACVLDELEEIDAALEAEFGWWAPEGGRSVWCDLPGPQAEAGGRRVFAPLDSAEAMEFELCGADDASCGAADVAPELAPWTWACRGGAESVLGAAVDWTCAGTGREGDAAARVVGRWAVDEAWLEAAAGMGW
jgi:hypothetical protein